MITVLYRCIIIYALLLAALRLTGKRQIGELEISELVTTLLLSELAVIPISESGKPLYHAIIPICTLTALEIVISFFTSRSQRLRGFIAGRPNMVIKDGTIDQGQLKKLRMSVGELMAQLRSKGCPDPASVKYAFFEEDGKLTVIDNSVDYIYCLVQNGEVSRFNLKESGWSKKRLYNYLSSEGARLCDIFLLTVNCKGEVAIIYKEGKKHSP